VTKASPAETPSNGWRRPRPALITLDTSGLFTLLNARNPDHARVRAALERTRAHLLPAGILAEIADLVERRLGVAVLDCGEDDFARVRELVRRYSDLPHGTADACVIACSLQRT
jgi:hypothetical protein